MTEEGCCHRPRLSLAAAVLLYTLDTSAGQSITAHASSGAIINVLPEPAIGDQVYSDRAYAFTSLGSFADTGMYHVQAPNNDKDTPSGAVMWTLTAASPVTIYLDFWRTDTQIASLGATDWLLSPTSQWVNRSDMEGSAFSGPWADTFFNEGPGRVFSRTFDAGVIEIMGNGGGKAGTFFIFVDVHQNLALNRPTAKSSNTHSSPSARAVDGDSNSHWFQGNSCTETQTGSGTSNPWWSVDLGSSFALSLVKIVHRTDCCKARMNGAMVYSTDENSVTSAMQGTACGTSTHSSGGPETIQCSASATPGRHVFVVIPGDGKIVQMCEFEAYGQLVRPIPLYVDTQAGSDEANGLTPGSAFATQSACREALQNGEGHVCRWSTGSEGQTQWELTTSILP